MLSSAISEEQFKFLSSNRIHNAMGTAKELMHSIKTQKLPTVAMKSELAQAYDKENWLFFYKIAVATDEHELANYGTENGLSFICVFCCSHKWVAHNCFQRVAQRMLSPPLPVLR